MKAKGNEEQKERKNKKKMQFFLFGGVRGRFGKKKSPEVFITVRKLLLKKNIYAGKKKKSCLRRGREHVKWSSC